MMGHHHLCWLWKRSLVKDEEQWEQYEEVSYPKISRGLTWLMSVFSFKSFASFLLSSFFLSFDTLSGWLVVWAIEINVDNFNLPNKASSKYLIYCLKSCRHRFGVDIDARIWELPNVALMRLLITITDRRVVWSLLRLASCANQLPQQHFLNNRSSRPFLPVKPREMNPTIYINAGDEGDTDDRGGRGWWGFQSSWRAPGFRPIIPHPKSPAREIPCQKLFSVCWDFSGLKTSSCLSIWEGRTIPKCKSLLDAKALFQINFFSFKYLIIEEISR